MKSNPRHIVMCVLGLAGLAMTGSQSGSFRSLEAGEPKRASVEFERADIPEDQPSAWPKEIARFEEYPRSKFLSIMEQIGGRNRGPRAAWLKSAHYEAVLVKDALRGGLMTASVQRFEGPPSLLEMGPFSFAFDELKWQDRPAIWGSSSDGRVWLLTDDRSTELLGDWTCQGRLFPGGIDFDLQLPVATTSFLDLRVPREFVVYSPGAEVTLLSDVPTEATSLWRIHCGSDSRCRVTCVSREGLAERRRALLVEHDLHVVVREEDLRFQLVLNLEALDAPIKDLVLRVPAGLKIHSVFYGTETPVSFQRSPESETDGRVSIRLPGALTGRGRTMRIDGIAAQKPGQPVISPQIVVEDSTFVGGRQVITVQSPLQVRSIRTNGYRQLTPLIPNPDGESLSFQQLIAEAQLILDVHRPPVSLSGQLFSLLSADDESWMLNTEIHWTSPTGGGYRTSCLFPPGWEVTDVQLNVDPAGVRQTDVADESQRLRESAKLNWEVQSQGADPTQGDGKSLLAIEFLEAIQPGQIRAVNVIARRRSPEPGQAVPVPIPQLMNCDTAEVILGIQIPQSMVFDISEDARLERIAPPTGIPFAALADNLERKWFRGDATDGAGTVKLSPRLPPVQARTEMAIEALFSEYRLRYSIQYEPREPLADRLLVYLSESNTDVRWTIPGSPAIDLSATRLKKSQHVEWSLPAKGELWEIRLPRSTGQLVQIEGISSNRWLSVNRPALILVPQAVDRLFQLKLSHPDSLELQFDVEGMKPTGQRLCWWYSTPDAEINLAVRNPEPSREFPLMVSMQLSTLMTTDSDGYDLYRARLQLENGSSHETLRIQLDPRAILDDTIVDGESMAANLRDGEFVIPGLNAGRGDVVELIYRVAARDHALYEKRQIIVPRVSARVLGFFWEFAIPPSAKIFAEPSSVRLSRSLPSPSWYERLFGPLGRGEAESIFNPLRWNDWKQLLQPESPRSPSFGTRDRVLVAPAEWQRHRAVSPDLPTDLYVELWHSSRVKLLNWISLGLSLVLGIWLRMLGWRYRDRVAAYVLGLSFSATLLAPSPYAECLGGAVAGTLISLLIPRRVLRQSRTREGGGIGALRRLPATLTAALVGGLTFFGLTGLLDQLAIAQDPAAHSISAEKPPTVFVPVDKNGQPSEILPLVYVPRDALERWKEMAKDRSAIPNYLITSANYELLGTAEGHLNLRARFRVQLLRSALGPVTVALPLADVSLPDADSCLVNGRSHPIGALPNGKGYSIELVRRDEAPEKDIADQAEEARAEDGVTTFDVELRLRKPRPTGSGIELTIPEVAKSRFSVALPAEVAYLEILGARGATDYGTDHRTAESELGSTSHFQVRWAQSLPVLMPRFASVSLLQHLELRPSSRELRFHLKANVDEGDLEAMEFDLPTDAVVRSIHSRADDLLRSDVIITKEGQRRLRLIFDRAHRSPVIVDGTLLLLQADSLIQTPLPRFGLAPSTSIEWRYDRNWWGVSAPADFRLETSNLDPENVDTISPEAYFQAWSESVDPRHLDAAVPRQTQATFALREGTTPTFQLIPHHSRRRALQWRQIGAIGKRRLEWTLIGEIETTSSPTFQTVLLVDRRLRIEKISVVENDAERLIRPSEYRADPSRVVLFLRDKPQAKQTITLRGSMPLRSGVPIALPFVRPEDCEVTGGRLLLTRDPEVDVIVLSREWKTEGDPLGEMSPEHDGQIVVGRFQLTDVVPRGTIQTSSRHSRCSARAAVFLRRTEGSNWKMTYRMEMTPEGESPMRMGLSFPTPFSESDGVTVERAEPAWLEHSEGSRHLDLLLNRGDGTGAVIVQYETTLVEPKLSDWELPLPIPLNSSTHETLLVIEPENIWFPAGGRDVRVADLPDWSKHVFNELPGGVQAFRIIGPSIRIQRDVSVPSVRQQSVRLLDQRIWLHQDGRSSGLTQAFLSTVRNDLIFEIPPKIHVTAMFLDDHPLPLNTTSEERLQVPMTDAGSESVLTMSWIADPDRSQGRLGQERLPWPLEILVEKNLITILPDDPTVLWSRSGLTPINSLDQGLDRLETLLDRHRVLGSETRGAVANRWGIHQLQARLLNQTAIEVQHPTKASLSRLSRRNQLVGMIDQLEPVPEPQPDNWQTRLMDEPVTDFAGALRGYGTQDGNLQLWLIDRRWLQGIFSSVLAIVLIPLFRRTIRLEWSLWLQRHVAVSWLLLATFWWLFLTPSAFGSILLVVAIIKAVTQYKPAKPAQVRS